MHILLFFQNIFSVFIVSFSEKTEIDFFQYNFDLIVHTYAIMI